MEFAIVLAAGMGTRMKSETPKVLHQVCGKPMLLHVLDTLKGLGVKERIAVLGHGIDKVKEVLPQDVVPVLQPQMLGTGDAVKCAIKALSGKTGDCLVLCGDTPLLKRDTLQALYDLHKEKNAAATILSVYQENPFGYGRILRDESENVVKIVEEKDADENEKKVKEVNTGAYLFDLKKLEEGLKSLKPANAQGEYYLTDVISYLTGKGDKVAAYTMKDPMEAMGVNDRVQLNEAQTYMEKEIIRTHMKNGVTFILPETSYIEAGVVIGEDTVIYPGTILKGNTQIGKGCTIGPYSNITDTVIGEGAVVKSSTVEGCEIGENCNIGPYSYLRPGCKLANKVKVGGFCEAKKLVADEGTKVPHLSYMGDVTIGKEVNIGAGTITCNYDGKNKFPTVIGDHAFIGSNTNLVAPVNVGEGAYVGAGSTITKDVPAGSLGVARAKQLHIENWKPKFKR